MKRNCVICGGEFEAKRSTAKYDTASCRARASQGAAVLGFTPERSTEDAGVVAATRRELEDAERLETALGQAALVLARRVESDRDTGSAAAALTREWRATLAEAVKGAGAQASPLDRARDELARRRAARGA